MGSALSPVVADIIMINLEVVMAKLESFKKVDLYKRYRDDYCVVWGGNRGEAQEFLEDLNTLDDNIKFTMELEVDNKLPFLDALLKREDSGISFQVYCKPYASGNILRFDSFHDNKVKRSIIIGETIRRGRISDDKEFDWEKLKTSLKDNGYPNKFIESNMEIGKRKVEQEGVTVMSKKEVDKGTLILPYEGGRNANRLRKLGKRFNIKPVFKKRRNLKSLFSKSYKKKTDIRAGGIYKIKCECNNMYIGETGDYLEKRIKKHKYSVKTLDQNNGIAVHSVECKENMKWNEANLISREKNWWKRKIKEGLFIQQDKPLLNITQGYKLIGKWN